jgi:hypothetical protein
MPHPTAAPRRLPTPAVEFRRPIGKAKSKKHGNRIGAEDDLIDEAIVPIEMR